MGDLSLTSERSAKGKPKWQRTFGGALSDQVVVFVRHLSPEGASNEQDVDGGGPSIDGAGSALVSLAQILKK